MLFSKDLAFMVTHSDAEIHIWDTNKNSIIKTVSPTQFPKLEPVDGVIPGMKFYTLSPDATKLAIATTHGKIWLWDWKQDKLIQQLDFMALPADELIFSEDSRFLAARAMYMKDGATQINIWDITTNKSLMQASSPYILLDENFRCMLGNANTKILFSSFLLKLVKKTTCCEWLKKRNKEACLNHKSCLWKAFSLLMTVNL